MSTKMSLVILKETGNVLAYATRTAAPPGLAELDSLEEEDQKALKAQELADLVGEKLSFRYPWDPTLAGFKAAEFEVSADELDVAVIDYEPAVADDPHSHYLDAAGQITFGAGKVKAIKGAADAKITVEVASAISSGARKVWLRVRGTRDEHWRMAKGTIEAAETDAELSMPELPPGDYLAFAAVTGLSPLAKKITIP